MDQPIDPKALMQDLSVAELCETAERYYAELPDCTHVLSKPFGSLLEAPVLLPRISPFLAGLRLGKSMTVLDFGAGTCWLSRLLNQLQCATISVDPSRTALELGRRLFEMSPIVGSYILPPRFVPFDGEHIDVPDGSVDRVACFDTFHHVPNQRQVLSEFYRVLRPGGIVGFSEPGPAHSQSPQAQEEMRTHKVLENDIRLDEIRALAYDMGFTDLRVKLVLDPNLDLTFQEYMSIVHSPAALWKRNKGIRRLISLRTAIGDLLRVRPRDSESDSPCVPALVDKVLNAMVSYMPGATVFFLTKGAFISDSRIASGLQYEMDVLAADRQGHAGQAMDLTVRVQNVGQGIWLHANIQDIGVVRLGVHLLGADHQMLNNDFARGELGRDIAPGESATVTCAITCPEPGDYVLGLDLVSEQVIWFEMLGNKPQYINIHVS